MNSRVGGTYEQRGFMFANDPKEITLYDIVYTLKGNASVECFGDYKTGIVESTIEGTNLNNIQVEVIYDIVTIDYQLYLGYVASSTNSIASNR